MTFIQTIAYTTSRGDEIEAMANELDNAGSPGFVSVKVCKDRDHENSYLVVAEFENYELAMQNSARPETDAFARKMAEMVDGPPVFTNYDVVMER